MVRTIKPDGSADFVDDGGTPAWRARQARNADFLRPLDAPRYAKPKKRTMWSKPRNQREALGGALKIILLGAGCIFMFILFYALTGIGACFIQGPC